MKKKILLVDDDLQMREMLYNLLTRKGCRVFTSSGAREAVEIIKKQNPDLVLLDAKMPHMSGIEVLKKIRRHNKKIKIVMLTAMDDMDLEKQARLHGASGFLKKQLDVDMILKSVDEILGERPPSEDGNKPILVVDDDARIRTLLVKFLKKRGFLAHAADSGESALEIVKREPPIVVLLDIKMPGMDGLVTLKKIKEIDAEMGVIMITGVNDQTTAEEAMKLGAYDYIIKPLDLDYLEMCLVTKIFLLKA